MTVLIEILVQVVGDYDVLRFILFPCGRDRIFFNGHSCVRAVIAVIASRFHGISQLPCPLEVESSNPSESDFYLVATFTVYEGTRPQNCLRKR